MSEQHDRHFNPGVMLFPLRKYASRVQYDFIRNNVKPGMTVLDLGSGPGFFTTRLAEAVGSNGVVYAVDGDEKAIHRLRSRINSTDLTNIKTHASSAASISFIPNESIDILFSNGLLCCMLDHKGAVNEMIRVMKTGSKGFISIAKILRRDGLGVSKKEWKEIMASFRVLRNGSTIMMDWAIVEKPGVMMNEL
ncbi:MAG: methyltransferase domain-containing protein [Nitrososphaeria archaeon]